jgi:hypothetical protein
MRIANCITGQPSRRWRRQQSRAGKAIPARADYPGRNEKPVKPARKAADN